MISMFLTPHYIHCILKVPRIKKNKKINLHSSTIRRTKDATTQAVCVGNAREYYSENGSSCFNKLENADVLYFDHIATATAPLPNH